MKFYLKKSLKKALIILKSWYHPSSALPFVFSTGESCKPEDWQQDKQAINPKAPGAKWLNAKLNRYRSEAVEFLHAYQYNNNSQPTHDDLKNHLRKIKDAYKGTTTTTTGEKITFLTYAKNHLKRLQNDPESSKHTAKMIGVLIQNIELFQLDTKTQIDFPNLNLQTFEKWQTWCYTTTVKYPNINRVKPPLAKNTVAGYWKRFKSILNEAHEDGFYHSKDHLRRSLAISFQEADEIFLTMDELMSIYHLDLTGSHLEMYRDYFLFNAFVGGWRFSDLTGITHANIITLKGDNILKFYTKKTDEAVYIPCGWFFEEFMKKYNNRPPKMNSGQKFNEHIKTICQKAGITQTIKLRKNVGGKNIIKEYQKYEAAHQYTARYSFATNLDEAGIPLLKIRDLMGHKNTKTTERYIKRQKLQTVKSAAEHPFFRDKPAAKH